MTSAASIAFPAKYMSQNENKNLAIQAISNEATISDVAYQNQVSRKFIYAQKNKAMSAINDVFHDDTSIDEVLFQLPVTKGWIEQFVTSLVLDGHSSFRGVIKCMNNLIDHDISIGSIYNIIQSAISKAKPLNDAQDLSAIKLAAHDEIFQNNKPVLTGVDIQSLYCFLLSQEDHRDGCTWALNLFDLQKQNYNPERVIADDGSGLRAGHEIVFPNTPCDADHFHITKTLMELRRFFRNKLKTAISYCLSIESKLEKSIAMGQQEKHIEKYKLAIGHKEKILSLSTSIDILVSWMEHDVLYMAGSNPKMRRELYNFIMDEFRRLENIHPNRIRAVRITLKRQRNLLLAFTDVLNEKFTLIANQSSLPLEAIWKMCELQRCKQGGHHYASRCLPLQIELGKKYDDIQDAVIAALSSTERTSSMVENLNSRVKPYFFLRKEIGNGYLDLLKFYLNHTPFLRSENPKRAGKSPTELLTGKPHANWLELLEFKQFKRPA